MSQPFDAFEDSDDDPFEIDSNQSAPLESLLAFEERLKQIRPQMPRLDIDSIEERAYPKPQVRAESMALMPSPKMSMFRSMAASWVCGALVGGGLVFAMMVREKNTTQVAQGEPQLQSSPDISETQRVTKQEKPVLGSLPSESPLRDILDLPENVPLQAGSFLGKKVRYISRIDRYSQPQNRLPEGASSIEQGSSDRMTDAKGLIPKVPKSRDQLMLELLN